MRLTLPVGAVHQASLKAKGVQQLSSVNCERIDNGLHVNFGPDHSDGQPAE
jgi:2,4-dienoyl-CoA reductase (NADPH2)